MTWLNAHMSGGDWAVLLMLATLGIILLVVDAARRAGRISQSHVADREVPLEELFADHDELKDGDR